MNLINTRLPVSSVLAVWSVLERGWSEGAAFYHYSLISSLVAALGFIVNAVSVGLVLILNLVLISAAQPNPALFPSLYIGPNQRQAVRARRDFW